MLTRYALFEGRLKPGTEAAFRAAILTEVLPTWRAFPGATQVQVGFAVKRDEGAPEYPLILSISYPDMATVEAALASPARARSRAATEAVLARFFEGRIHHHWTEAETYAPQPL